MKDVIARGIRFSCTGCGACCTGAGTVFANQAEVDAIAAHLNRPVESFASAVPEGYHFFDNHLNDRHDCIFYENQRCTLHALRPTQCRTFPFWINTLRSPERWAETRAGCEGIGQGHLYTGDDILALLDIDIARTTRTPGHDDSTLESGT